MPLARRRRLDGAQRLVGLTQGDDDALNSGDVSAASTPPKCRYTCARVRALPTGTALAAVGPGIPTILAIGTTTPTLHLAKSAEEILDRLAGSCRSLNN